MDLMKGTFGAILKEKNANEKIKKRREQQERKKERDGEDGKTVCDTGK